MRRAAPCLSALAKLADAVDMTTDPDVLEAHRRDQAALGMLEPGVPAALIRAKSTQDVQSVLRLASDSAVAVVPRGAGSGLSGGANAVDGCWILALDRMTEVTVLPEAMQAIVQPGAINKDVKDAAAVHGLRYPPDPASADFCTIGGNIATNAGGLCCVKHGVTREFVLGLEVVLADGDAVRVGGSSRKDVVGYDLVSLMCGSEGTLGVVTEARLRLVPEARRAATLAASFPSLRNAGRAVAAVMRRFVPSLLELMDRTSINAVEDVHPMELDRDAEALLFARADEGVEEIERMAEICYGFGASIVVTSDEEAEGRMLMAARRLAYPALERRGATLLDDVGVPLDRMADLLEGVQRIAEANGVLVATFGHAGDGNMHPTVVYDRADRGEARRARATFQEILALSLSLGGTITGEHGVGALKRGMVEAQLGTAHRVHAAVKAALDPAGTLNPGKAL